VYLRGQASTLDYVDILYGQGVNLGAAAVLRHCNILTNTYGLACHGPWAVDVASCTVQYNGVGVLLYGEASPVISYCNVLSSTLYDVQVDQARSVAMASIWWGADPPDPARVLDITFDMTRGDVDQSEWASSVVLW